VLRAELTERLRVEWSPVRHGIAEVRGVPRHVREVFSRRRQEIQASLEERGASGHRAAEAAALATRRRKSQIAERGDLPRAWRRRVDELGCEPTVPTRGGADRPPPLDDVAQQLLCDGTLTARRSSFTRRDVITALCERADPGGPLSAGELERVADEVLASEAVIRLLDRPNDDAFVRRDGRVLRVAADDRVYSTAAHLSLERSVLEAVARGGRLVLASPPISLTAPYAAGPR
jgi:hypothetical protein